MTIGQRWRRRSRKKVKPVPIVIYQVYRHERYVLARFETDSLGRPCPHSGLQRIQFADLRAKYALLNQSDKETHDSHNVQPTK